MATHTPLPWLDLHGQYIIPASHANRRIGGSTNAKQDREEFAHAICRIERNDNRFTADEASANAALIVKAVNAYEKLVTALHNLEVAANTVQHCYDRCPENFAFAMTQLQHDAEQARAALAVVEAQ